MLISQVDVLIGTVVKFLYKILVLSQYFRLWIQSRNEDISLKCLGYLNKTEYPEHGMNV